MNERIPSVQKHLSQVQTKNYGRSRRARPALIQVLRSTPPSGIRTRCALAFCQVLLRGSAVASEHPSAFSLHWSGPSGGVVAIRVMASPCRDAMLQSVIFLVIFLFARSFTVEDAGAAASFRKDASLNDTGDAALLSKEF
jgi:hypothetical protein